MKNKNNKDRNEIVNIVNSKKHLADTKFLVKLVLWLVVILFLSTSFIFRQLMETARTIERSNTYVEEAKDLIQMSDYLTARVYYYVATGDVKYLDEYYTAIEERGSKGLTVLDFLEISETTTEKEIIESSIELKYILGDIENKAFELVAEGKKEEAYKLIFSSEYVENKDQLQINYIKFVDEIDGRVKNESNRYKSLTQITLIMSYTIAISTTIVVVLLIFTLYKIKKESDIDQLTGLQNRNNYKKDIETLIASEEEKFGALLCCNIDNFKYINECYGHSSSDRYIKATANVLKSFGKYKSVIARPFGDEFIVYIHGFNSKDEVVKAISEKMNKSKDAHFTTTLNIDEKIRFSTGIAIYPTDTKEVDDLIKFADYAMYRMKKNSKGEIGYYDSTTLDQTLYLARNSGYLDEFLDKELLDFALQPMVDSNTFKVIGYEALMRPQSDIINTPYLLLELAKTESKLDKIERLVMKKVFEKIDENFESLKNYKIFINSIADQVLTEEEFSVYKEKYPHILNKIVLEVTEQESVNFELLEIKSKMFKAEGAMLAIDDFGAGYSNENSLLSNDYDIIKLDMNLIRNIDTDNRRKQIVKSIIDFSNANKYKILAEGVETENEVRELRYLGIHYMQGYYFGRPEFDIKGVSEKALKFLYMESEQ